MDNLLKISDIFQLMLDLSQMESVENSIDNFVEGLNNHLDTVKFKRYYGKENDNSFKLATDNFYFGQLLIQGKMEDIPADTIILILKSVKLFSILLENKKTHKFLTKKHEELVQSTKDKSRQMHQIENKYYDLAEIINEALVVLDQNYNIQLWNKKCIEYTGKKVTDVLGKTLWQALPNFDKNKVIEILNQSQTQEEIVLKQSTSLHKIDYTFEITIIYKKHSYFLLLKDITEAEKQKQNELKLKEKINLLNKIESLNMMAGGIAHDFNNMLAVIMGHLSLLKSKDNDQISRESLEDIEIATTKMSKIVQNILAYSGNINLNRSKVSLFELITEIIHQVKPGLPPNINLVLETALKNSVVNADIKQLRSALFNILANSLEALENKNNGKIKINIGLDFFGPQSLKESEISTISPGEYYYIEVHDNGHGIGDDILPQIFDPFFTTKFQGRGLGLSSVFGIIKSHKGSIIVKSTSAKFTMVKILLPPAQKGDLNLL